MSDEYRFEFTPPTQLAVELERPASSKPASSATRNFTGGIANSTTVDFGDWLRVPGISFKERLEHFLDPDKELRLVEQLATMAQFWRKLGITMPALPESDRSRIEDEIEANPDYRIVPSYLNSDADHRAWAVELRMRSPWHWESTSDEVGRRELRVDAANRIGRRLIRAPHRVVEQGQESYALGYKTPHGKIVSRSAYVQSLLRAGQAVTTRNGAVWVFPIVELFKPLFSKEPSQVVQGNEDTVVPPETIIALQLMREAGDAINEEAVDCSNEGLYKVREVTDGDNTHFEYEQCLGLTTIKWRLPKGEK